MQAEIRPLAQTSSKAIKELEMNALRYQWFLVVLLIHLLYRKRQQIAQVHRGPT